MACCKSAGDPSALHRWMNRQPRQMRFGRVGQGQRVVANQFAVQLGHVDATEHEHLDKSLQAKAPQGIEGHTVELEQGFHVTGVRRSIPRPASAARTGAGGCGRRNRCFNRRNWIRSTTWKPAACSAPVSQRSEP